MAFKASVLALPEGTRKEAWSKVDSIGLVGLAEGIYVRKDGRSSFYLRLSNESLAQLKSEWVSEAPLSTELVDRIVAEMHQCKPGGFQIAASTNALCVRIMKVETDFVKYLKQI